MGQDIDPPRRLLDGRIMAPTARIDTTAAGKAPRHSRKAPQRRGEGGRGRARLARQPCQETTRLRRVLHGVERGGILAQQGGDQVKDFSQARAP